MPRFVILTHDRPTIHWDFLLEDGATCRAWRLLWEPRIGTEPIPSESNFPHRLHYLTYEGPLSANRGTVVRWDAGTFDWIDETPLRERIRLWGRRLRGGGRCTKEGWLFTPTEET